MFMELKTQINSSSIVVVSVPLFFFLFLFFTRYKSSGQKINRETSGLSEILHQMDLTDVYRAVTEMLKEHRF